MSDKKIAHVVTDEKFINSVHWQFEEVFPCQNTFFVFVDDFHSSFNHIKFNDGIIKIKKEEESIKLLNKKLDEYDVVVLHSLSYYHSILVNNTKNLDKFVWSFWGGEFYNNPEVRFKFPMVGDITNRKLLGRNRFMTILKSIKNRFFKYFQVRKSSWSLISKAAKKIDRIAVIHREDVEMLKEYNYVKANAKYIQFSYYPLEYVFKNYDQIDLGNNILVGNSATPTNNHGEVFELLSKFSLGDRKIIVPLSYGNEDYAKKVNYLGRNIFKDSFLPLMDFMSFNEYNKLIQQCGIVVINTYRQQAIGNILTLLWMGAKIYLDNRNTFFNYLKRKGFIVLSINEDLNINNSNALLPLSIDEKKHNRDILKKETSKEKLFSILKNEFGK
ncbi:TDP-N-acetylfucosamine:lipid II N-acetylfucosaminyltransferase [uncultured Tenacibaculum sp.]|uniref:TDP-N-acetylfucosamine:lipid II N-acetylfucosaminyltransferase n=1 Tax=uncultured Tenacibaculum sp. TaxID=174713 RepID=UPI0026118166|nr:TDP-N-acetylfucosamine:lipid II N-acetylfucosaminyltransferase [uncultured Tenacibaculum sp.]